MAGKRSIEERKRDLAEKDKEYSRGRIQGERVRDGFRRAQEIPNWPLQMEWLRRAWR